MIGGCSWIDLDHLLVKIKSNNFINFLKLLKSNQIKLTIMYIHRFWFGHLVITIHTQKIKYSFKRKTKTTIKKIVRTIDITKLLITKFIVKEASKFITLA